eukprot:3938007-Rhodomonas_salina.1
MSLLLPASTVVPLLRGLSLSEHYCLYENECIVLENLHTSARTNMRGYWKAKPEAFARDAMVYERLLTTRLPGVAKLLRESGVVPEAYAQKWFCGTNSAPICLRLPYAMSVTDILYGPTRPLCARATVQAFSRLFRALLGARVSSLLAYRIGLRACYAMPSTAMPCGTTSLRACYAIPSTDVAYGALWRP